MALDQSKVCHLQDCPLDVAIQLHNFASKTVKLSLTTLRIISCCRYELITHCYHTASKSVPEMGLEVCKMQTCHKNNSSGFELQT